MLEINSALHVDTVVNAWCCGLTSLQTEAKLPNLYHPSNLDKDNKLTGSYVKEPRYNRKSKWPCLSDGH